LNLKNKAGDSAVMAALKEEKSDIVKFILELPGVDLNTKDKDNKTLEQLAR
jgi:ankyrin repeat protein